MQRIALISGCQFGCAAAPAAQLLELVVQCTAQHTKKKKVIGESDVKMDDQSNTVRVGRQAVNF